MPNLTMNVQNSVTGIYQSVNLAEVIARLSGTGGVDFTTGTGDYQADLCYPANRSLASNAADLLDLAGSLVDPLGNTLTFVEVTAIVVRSDAANTTNLTLGNPGANGFFGPFGATTHTNIIQPGGAVVLIAPKAGWPVTAGTGDILRIANAAGATANYSLIIIGRSA